MTGEVGLAIAIRPLAASTNNTGRKPIFTGNPTSRQRQHPQKCRSCSGALLLHWPLPGALHGCQGTAQLEAQMMRADRRAHCHYWDVCTQAMCLPHGHISGLYLTTEGSTQVSAAHLWEWSRFGMLQLSPCLVPAGQDMFSGHPRTLLSFHLQHHQHHSPAQTRACSISHLSLAHSRSVL